MKHRLPRIQPVRILQGPESQGRIIRENAIALATALPDAVANSRERSDVIRTWDFDFETRQSKEALRDFYTSELSSHDFQMRLIDDGSLVLQFHDSQRLGSILISPLSVSTMSVSIHISEIKLGTTVSWGSDD